MHKVKSDLEHYMQKVTHMFMTIYLLHGPIILHQRLGDGGVTPMVCDAFDGIGKAWHYLQDEIAAARA
jgi:hypothetical protein